MADASLVGLPEAGVLVGLEPHATLLVAGRTARPEIAAHVVTLPVADNDVGSPFVATACAGAAARLCGVIRRATLEHAVRHELDDMSDAVVLRDVGVALDAFDAMGELEGSVTPGPDHPADRGAPPDWIDPPLDDPHFAAPSIHGGATSLAARTGLWRTLRPQIDPYLCHHCAWLCSTLCPDGAITADGGLPVIDLRALQGLPDLRRAVPVARDRHRARGRGSRSMTRELLTGNAAAAWAARLADIDYVPAFPITPQTEIIETLAAWIDRGELDARMVTLESEHSMITAAGAAAATGARVFTATSSQGLLYAMEMLYTVAGWRAPFVLVNVSRGLSAPITLEPDHNDVLAARDSGFLQIHAATCQEVLDTMLMAYRHRRDIRACACR